MDNSVIKIKQKNNSSIIIDVNQTAHSLSVGDVVYYSKSIDSYYGRYEKANASMLETANAIGFVYKVVNANSFQLITQGLIDNIRFKDYPVGTLLYLGITNGNVIDTEQIYSKPLGIKVRNGLLINIQRGVINNQLLNGQTKEDTNGFIEGSSATSSSDFIVSQTSHDFVVGDALFYNNGKYQKGLAAISDAVEIIGVVASVVDANTFKICINGFISTTVFDLYTDGTIFFLSDIIEGLLTDIEPAVVSKPIASKIANGIIVNIQRGSLNNSEDSNDITLHNIDDRIGDFKYSYDTTEVRTDGYILFKENIEYSRARVQELLNNVSNEFLTNYIIVGELAIRFKNTDNIINTASGTNLYIKAFSNGLVELHTHVNKITLDNLSEGLNQTLLYKNNPISGSGGGNSIYQKIELNVSTAQTLYIQAANEYTQEKAIVQLYKFITGSQNIIEILKTFNNANTESFYHNNTVEFNGAMRIKDVYSLNKIVDVNGYSETEIINKNEFIELYGIEVGL